LPREPIVERREYLRALEREWPEAVEQFDSFIASNYSPTIYKKRNRKREWSKTDSLAMLRSDQDPDRIRWLKDLEDWARRYEILEDWILEVAVFTCFWCYWPSRSAKTIVARVDGDESFLYEPSLIFSTPFQPHIDSAVWLPPSWNGLETWLEFKKRVTSQFDEQLRQYASVFGVDHEHIARDAAWTVRYQRGQSAFEISQELTGYKDAEQSTYRAIQRFAKIIGVRLRRNQKRDFIRLY